MFNEIGTSRAKTGQIELLDAPRRPQRRRHFSQAMFYRARRGFLRVRLLLHDKEISNSHAQDRTGSSQDDAVDAPRRRQDSGHSPRVAAGQERTRQRRKLESGTYGNFSNFRNPPERLFSASTSGRPSPCIFLSLLYPPPSLDPPSRAHSTHRNTTL